MIQNGTFGDFPKVTRNDTSWSRHKLSVWDPKRWDKIMTYHDSFERIQDKLFSADWKAKGKSTPHCNETSLIDLRDIQVFSCSPSLPLQKTQAQGLVRVVNRQVAWVNFSEICGMMKRPVEHVQQFVLAEFGTEGAIAGTATARAEGQGQDGQLVLKGRYQPKHCESLLRKCLCLRSKDVLFFDLMLFLDASCVIFSLKWHCKLGLCQMPRYIKEYVTCEMCKSAQTTLRKDPSTRLTLVECSRCGASRTAASIKAGFHAVTRGDRKAAKQAKWVQVKRRNAATTAVTPPSMAPLGLLVYMSLGSGWKERRAAATFLCFACRMWFLK